MKKLSWAKINKSKKLSRTRTGDMGIFIFLCIFGAFMILPFVYAIVQSLKPMDEIFAFPPKFFVRRPTFNNYYQLGQLASNLWVPFGRYLFNSLSVTFLGVTIHIIIASMAAFVLAKYKFPGNKVMNEIIVVALLFTAPVTAIPQYVIMAKVGLIDTYWAMLLPPLAAPMGLYLMKNFFVSSVPNALIESAKIDGAGIFRIYWQIAMPLAKPAWVTLIIFTFQTYWSGTGANFIYTESLKPLTTILNQISTAGIARVGVGAAVAVVMMLPPLITFIISQSNVLETMAQSGIKD